VVTVDPAGLPPTERAGHTRRRRALEKAGAELLALPGTAQAQVPLPAVLAALAARGVQSLLIEGGSAVHGAFIAARLVDEVAFFLAPRLVGGGVPLSAGPGLPFDAPLRLGPVHARDVDGDILLTASVIQEPEPPSL
jgi:diaminohydroxyphosphoribosylaminopyrimidine deaminase/5-amino-6-(5-phosphoribosylamino)uracil reductase